VALPKPTAAILHQRYVEAHGSRTPRDDHEMFERYSDARDC